MDYSILGLVNRYREHYDPNAVQSSNDNLGNSMELTTGFLLIIMIVGISLWIGAIVLLANYWPVLPSWAKAVGLIGLLPVVPMGPVVTIIVVLVGKNQSKL